MGPKMQKMAIFCPKIVQVIQNVDIVCIYCVFINSQTFEKFRQILVNFWRKYRVFSLNRQNKTIKNDVKSWTQGEILTQMAQIFLL